MESPTRVAPVKQKRWSQRVTESSNALDLEPGVFTYDDPRQIAESLKRSAEHSQRRKAGPFRSAMSMLTFYINRAGNRLPTDQRKRLEEAKEELRNLFGKPYRRPCGSGTATRACNLPPKPMIIHGNMDLLLKHGTAHKIK
jgi:hypothetical protein